MGIADDARMKRQCLGAAVENEERHHVGRPGIDFEDAPKGFGAHSDQERLLEIELHRFVRFNWEVVTAIAGAK